MQKALIPELPMQGNCAPPICGQILTHNAPAWMCYRSPSCSLSQQGLFSRTHPLALTGHSSHWLQAQPPPLLLLYTAMSVREAWSVFLWFSFGSASFFSPKATQTAPPTATLFISLFCYQPSIFYLGFVLPRLQPLISIILKSSAQST